MNKKLELFFLILIIFIASILRLWGLGLTPPSPDWDEVALGYNAYSVIQNGRDEYGKFMPFILESFDDYKPALYMYLIVPFIYLFDLTIIAVRMPSAILGILSVLAVYYLLKELFRSSRAIPLTGAFLLAISPMSIQFSRVAFETNAGAALNIFAALFFIKGLKKPWLLSFSTAIMGLNLYMYQSDKVFTPLLCLAMIIIFAKNLFKIKKIYLYSAFIIGLLIAAPLIYYSVTNQQAFARAKGVSIFSDRSSTIIEEEQKWADDYQNNNITGKLFHNKWITYGREIVEGYLLHFDFNWLFIRGDLARHHAPEMSILYFWELPFLLIGIYLMIFSNFPKSTKLLFFSWFFLAPVPASVTNGLPHAVRTLNFLPTFQVFIAIGLIYVISNALKIKYHLYKIHFKYLLPVFIIAIMIFNFLYYLNQYFIQQNYFYSQEWQYGYKDAVEEVAKIQGNYEKVIVSNQYPLDQSYMFFLFYLKYPPLIYQNEDLSRTGGFREVHHFGKYEFRPIDWPNEKNKANTLYVGSSEDFNRGGHAIKTINYLNGKPSIYIYKQ